jgi:hypothetical protein
MRISKIVCAVMIGLVAFSLNATKESKKLQILINPADPTFSYTLFNGSAILINDLSAVRPIGGYYYLNGLILPGGTISKNQASFAVDKHGNPITAADSLGLWECIGKVLQTLDFSDIPAEGTLVEAIEWDFYFDEDCHNYPNIMTSLGKTVTGSGFPAFTTAMAMVGGTRCNKNNNHYTSKIYISQTGQFLIKMTFQDDVKYDS